MSQLFREELSGAKKKKKRENFANHENRKSTAPISPSALDGASFWAGISSQCSSRRSYKATYDTVGLSLGDHPLRGRSAIPGHDVWGFAGLVFFFFLAEAQKEQG